MESNQENRTDVLARQQRETSLYHMKAAFNGLVGHRRQIHSGKDLFPSYDIARFWTVVVGAFSLLEQSLKLLVSAHTEGYLRRPRKGTSNKEGQSPAEKDSHRLFDVFGRLRDEDKNLLEDLYREYASFAQFDSEFSTLGQYLKALDGDRGQVAWRYFLLEGTGKLSGPLNPDVLLELIAGTIDILSREFAPQWHGMHGVHCRLGHALTSALNDAALDQAAASDGISDKTFEDMNTWKRGKYGHHLINAFSKYIRTKYLDGEYGEEVVAWLSRSVEHFQKSAQMEGDVNLLLFLQMATRCCATTDGKRFTFRNHLPQKIWESRHTWHEGWAVGWRKAGGPWRTVAIEYPPNHHYEDWGLPLRAGQMFATVSEMEDRPTMGEIDPTKAVDLRILRNGKVLAQMRAKFFSYTPSAGIVGEDEPPESMGRNGDDEKVTHMEFIRVGDCLPEGESDDANAPGFPRLVNSYACLECAGTGFCPDCLGEADAGDCQTCPGATGLCPACKGHGMDGHHEIVASTEAS